MGRLSTQRGKAEQAHIEQLLRSVGAKVYHVGTVRRRGDYHGTMQTPGIPDVLAFLPPRPSARVMPPPRACLWVLLFVESKAGKGRLSPEQRDFRDLCLAAEVHHVVGNLDAVIAWCIDHGYLARENVPHYRQPPARELSPAEATDAVGAAFTRRARELKAATDGTSK